ncbi:hypothetical protein [Streptomyces sp. 8N616]
MTAVPRQHVLADVIAVGQHAEDRRRAVLARAQLVGLAVADEDDLIF